MYYGKTYLENIVKSIEENAKELKNLNKDYEIELVIVNDSPKEKLELPKSKLSIKLLEHDQNYGIHKSRIDGLIASSGEYIKFLDQDDEISFDCIKNEISLIEDGDVLVSNAYMEKEDKTKELLYSAKSKTKVLNLKSYTCSHNQIASPGQCLIKKAAIPKEWTDNILDVNGLDDLFLWVLMFCKGSIFKFDPAAYYTHKNTGSNVSARSSSMAKSSLSFISYLENIFYVKKSVTNTLLRSRSFDLKLEALGESKNICMRSIRRYNP